MKVPLGFLFNAISTGIKSRGKDLGVVISEKPATAVGFFTSNEFKSESVLICKQHLKNGLARAIIVNSGNANCATGESGFKLALAICEKSAREIDCRPDDILVASTGRIGVPLPQEKVIPHLSRLISQSSSSKASDFAWAITTTDKYPKYCYRELSSGARILGIAKGAGMIEPNLATTLCFLLTDAKIKRSSLKKILREALNFTFERISVDAEQSTNDSFIFLANGASGLDVEKDKKSLQKFVGTIFEVLQNLAYSVLRDGEGATKVVKIVVKNSKTRAIAEQVARRVSRSLLFKSSLYGENANWGRLLACIGSLRLGIGRELDIYYGRIRVVKSGVSLYQKKKLADAYLKENDQIEISIDLKKGRFNYWLYTTDLTPEYVRLNK